MWIWIYFFQGTVVEMVFNNKIQIFSFSIQFILLKGKKKLCTLLKEL
jgi:hypothetical protein